MTTPLKSRAAAAFALLAAVSFAVSAAQTTAAVHEQRTGCTGAYGWPLKPFDRAHPVRANFGDPRTRFEGENTAATLLEGGGAFSFHQGVDISAQDGEAVYAVASGTVTRARGGRVTIHCGNGRSFQYWHIVPAVRVGHRTVVGKTVVGFVQPKREHVHLTHLEGGAAVNPLAPGRLAPYRDLTAPAVSGASIGPSVEGGMSFVVEAEDSPAMSVPGRWHGFPVTPALVTWRIEHDGLVVVSTRVVRDVRRWVPRNDRFWDTFARGTHQNWPIFAGRKFQFTPGTYLFALSLGATDTLGLVDGAYELVVTAADTGDNTTERRFGITLRGSLASLSGSWTLPERVDP